MPLIDVTHRPDYAFPQSGVYRANMELGQQATFQFAHSRGVLRNPAP